MPAAGGGVHHRRAHGAGTCRTPHDAGVEHGVIQDRLFLPGFAKLLFSKQAGFVCRTASPSFSLEEHLLHGMAASVVDAAADGWQKARVLIQRLP